MDDVISKLVAALKTTGYTVKELGSYGDGEKQPETYIMYQLISSPDVTHYDNHPESTEYTFMINVYTKKASIKLTADTMLRSMLLPLGFIRGSGHFLPITRETGHHTYTIKYKYYDNE